jgi:hypothetical protein
MLWRKYFSAAFSFKERSASQEGITPRVLGNLNISPNAKEDVSFASRPLPICLLLPIVQEEDPFDSLNQAKRITVDRRSPSDQKQIHPGGILFCWRQISKRCLLRRRSSYLRNGVFWCNQAPELRRLALYLKGLATDPITSVNPNDWQKWLRPSCDSGCTFAP